MQWEHFNTTDARHAAQIKQDNNYEYRYQIAGGRSWYTACEWWWTSDINYGLHRYGMKNHRRIKAETMIVVERRKRED
jgi:hypothetical protein